MIFRFLWSLLTRFAKTVGCLLFIAGLAGASSLYRTRQPMIDAAQYRETETLGKRLDILQSAYGNTQLSVRIIKGGTEFPPEYAAARFEPQFPAHFASLKEFHDLRAQLTQVSAGRDAMKRYVTDHIESLLSDIQQKLLAHAASLSPPPAPIKGANRRLRSDPTSQSGIYDDRLNSSEVNARKSALENAKEFLGMLQLSAEDSENKKKLGDSVSEIDALAKLLPSIADPQNLQRTPDPSELLNAAKVAKRLAELRGNIARAVLSSWSLDEAIERASQTADEEQAKFLAAEFEVKRLSAELLPLMATSITVGTVLSLFFLLIGDWTQKSSTEVHVHWCELIPGITATPSEVYDTVEDHVAKIKVPELEISRPAWHEGGALSAKRQYLRISRERLVFDICAAPFGTGFFISFRCSEEPLVVDPVGIFLVLSVIGIVLSGLVLAFGLTWGAIILAFTFSVLVFFMRSAVLRGLGNIDRVLMKTPLIAPLYELFLRPLTYYRIDTTVMYLKAVQGATSEAFESIFGDLPTNLLPGTVSQPVLDGIYGKRILYPERLNGNRIF